MIKAQEKGKGGRARVNAARGIAMLKSMTGYGRGRRVADDREILVEIKSVNHRYFEYSARVPKAYGYLESKMKALVSAAVSRGKVEVGVSVYSAAGKDAAIALNRSLAQGYLSALRAVKDDFSLKDDLSLSDLASFPDVFTVTREIEDEDEIWALVKPAAEEALASFVSMRETEGRRLGQDLLLKLDEIEALVSEVEKQSPKTVEAYRARLYEKLCEVLQTRQVDPQRILTEAALFAEKVAVDEETVRLRSHIKQFRSLLDEAQPVGKKLDFLVQEINRESNTIGSKASDLEIAKIVIELKSTIEKIREQIQNIE